MITKTFVWRCLCVALLRVAVVAAPTVANEGKDEAHGKERKERKDKHSSKAKDWPSYLPTAIACPFLPGVGVCSLLHGDAHISTLKSSVGESFA
jgi:hypothetical protein